MGPLPKQQAPLRRGRLCMQYPKAVPEPQRRSGQYPRVMARDVVRDGRCPGSGHVRRDARGRMAVGAGILHRAGTELIDVDGCSTNGMHARIRAAPTGHGQRCGPSSSTCSDSLPHSRGKEEETGPRRDSSGRFCEPHVQPQLFALICLHTGLARGDGGGWSCCATPRSVRCSAMATTRGCCCCCRAQHAAER